MSEVADEAIRRARLLDDLEEEAHDRIRKLARADAKELYDDAVARSKAGEFDGDTVREVVFWMLLSEINTGPLATTLLSSCPVDPGSQRVAVPVDKVYETPSRSRLAPTHVRWDGHHLYTSSFMERINVLCFGADGVFKD